MALYRLRTPSVTQSRPPYLSYRPHTERRQSYWRQVPWNSTRLSEPEKLMHISRGGDAYLQSAHAVPRHAPGRGGQYDATNPRARSLRLIPHLARVRLTNVDLLILPVPDPDPSSSLCPSPSRKGMCAFARHGTSLCASCSSSYLNSRRCRSHHPAGRPWI